MRCWWHRWTKWEDVELYADREAVKTGMFTLYQQRRCTRCNKVESRQA